MMHLPTFPWEEQKDPTGLGSNLKTNLPRTQQQEQQQKQQQQQQQQQQQ